MIIGLGFVLRAAEEARAGEEAASSWEDQAEEELTCSGGRSHIFGPHTAW